LARRAPERRVKHRATDPLYKGEQGQEKAARDRLVFASRHRQDLHRAFGELNETICLVSESEVLLLGPETLQWQEINLQPSASHTNLSPGLRIPRAIHISRSIKVVHVPVSIKDERQKGKVAS
jgi:hypothetical protein